MRWQNENPSNDNTKVAKISKVDSRIFYTNAIFAATKNMDCHATATQCLAMTEKSTASKKVDSSNKAFLSSLRALRSKAWQSTQTKTQALESTFKKTAELQSKQSVASLENKGYRSPLGDVSLENKRSEVSLEVDCHATATQCLAMTEKSTASKKVDSRICDEKTSEAVQGAAEAGFFSKAESSSKKPTPPTNHAAGGRIFSEKAGLCSLLCGDKPSGLLSNES